ncbi:POU class 2 homeobox associating factor 3 [Diceros bicornis minor]|uniref:POU class 2 homeobox associating factor 3 n=1 Tax=Diceros bicornis minor TaxID=77932 RepID=UPI0026EBD138|nr:POU class 2 homeobox associating factor 3 [Diceros bicornis minor]
MGSSPRLVSTFLSRKTCVCLSPEKPKVYQGVRVKITVKELLQQRRAHQAASGGTLSGGSRVHLSDPVAPSSAGLYFEPEPISSTPNYFQPREFSSCVSCEENPSCLDQIFDSYLQTETHPDPPLNSMQSTPHYFPDSFQAAPFSFNQSLTPGSPSDCSTLSGSLDYSYSPAQLPSYVPENYNSLPSLDTRNCGYPSEDYSYPLLPSHAQYDCFSSATTSVCYCASCEAEHLDTIRASEYFSYPSTDYVNFAPSAAGTSDFYKRETNCDICYS